MTDIAFFGAKSYERTFFDAALADKELSITYLEPRVTPETLALADGYPVVCVFVNDHIDASMAEQLSQHGVKLIALRCAGFNNIDLTALDAQGIRVVRVPAYSPYAVAEHTAALILSLNRKVHRSFNRVRESNFNLDGLLGFDLHGQTIGIMGTGKIGECFARIMKGFGLNLLAYDPHVNPECEALGVSYVDLDTLFAQSDIISLHCPLMPATHHIINRDAIAKMKPGVMLINTSRGALVNTQDVIEGLKQKQIGYLGLDVYEEEESIFFEDHSTEVMQDDVFARLLTFPNVIITGHQAFFTSNALQNIAETTIQNIHAFLHEDRLENEVRVT